MKNVQKTYSYIDFPPLTEQQKAEIENLKNMSDEDIDYSDIPEVKENCELYYFQSLKIPKTRISTFVDNDTLTWLKRSGKGYQTRLNNVLRWARANNCPINKL